ncbi:hypothetical protein I5I45_12155 [Pseudomonas aeruginosa]|nr:hypothetical protein [Pseudomonas aeruginosa]
MTSKGLTSALLLASMFAATSGCLQQNALTQGYRTTQPGQPGQAQVASANTPCTPSATNDLIATGRSLLDITTNLIKPRNQMSDGGSIMRDVDDVQKVGKGHAVLDSVESMTGGPQQPCG